MRISTEALSTMIVVRRVASGITPFRWEVHGADSAEPVFVSPERFRGMEAAYSAGQARLAEFVPKRLRKPDANANFQWRSSDVADNAAAPLSLADSDHP